MHTNAKGNICFLGGQEDLSGKWSFFPWGIFCAAQLNTLKSKTIKDLPVSKYPDSAGVRALLAFPRISLLVSNWKNAEFFLQWKIIEHWWRASLLGLFPFAPPWKPSYVSSVRWAAPKTSIYGFSKGINLTHFRERENAACASARKLVAKHRAKLEPWKRRERSRNETGNFKDKFGSKSRGNEDFVRPRSTKATRLVAHCEGRYTIS